MSADEDNAAIQKDLTRMVVEEITGLPFETVNVAVKDLAINYFSFVFAISIRASSGSWSVFVKIPKKDILETGRSILPITSSDRRMAEDEEVSLRALEAQWHSDDLDVFWIRLRAVLPYYNAIVTDASEGDDAFAVFRRLDLRRRFGSNHDRLRLRQAMARLGDALGRFHGSNSRNTCFRTDEMLPKLERYCRELLVSTGSPLLTKVIRALGSMAGREFHAVEVLTLKGIDIRNVLMDRWDRLFLLDPGRMKRTCREADLARFIMTYRIIYWGSLLFFLRLRPDVQAEEAFFAAYYSNTQPASKELLNLFLIKEQLKHWAAATYSLQSLNWPVVLKRFVAAIYINPYYAHGLATELKRGGFDAAV